MELNSESFNAGNDALEEMVQIKERKFEWNVSYFTSLERALEIRVVLSEAILKAK